MKELQREVCENILIEYEENAKKIVTKQVSIENSFRVYRDGMVGIHYNVGDIPEEEGFAKAEAKLQRERPYPFVPEPGTRHRDLSQHEFTEEELVDIADRCMEYLLTAYPDYTFGATYSIRKETVTRKNDAGMDYRNADSCVVCSISFKHKESKDVSDGGFSYNERSFCFDKFKRMADDYLENFTKMVDFPEELIIDEQYYGIAGELLKNLNGERIFRKVSLFSDKVGEKVFSEDLTLAHDVSDAESWFNPFWDGDGSTFPDDRILFIDHGKILSGIADKRDAKRFDIPYTGPAGTSYADIPTTGNVNVRLERSGKTVKELLNGRYAIIPVMAYGGGFNEKGEYTMPVHSSLLFDGERILGKLPPFTIVTNLFDMFGKDFIGVASDQPVYNDKQILYRVKRGELK